MSRAHIETVAERAAHFEEVDPERYNRLKNKFYELDLNQQQELLQMHNMHYPVNSNSGNSNLLLLNHFVESLMMSPSYLNSSTTVTNNATAKTTSKSHLAKQTTDCNNNGSTPPTTATTINDNNNNAQNSNYSNSMNEYSGKGLETKKHPSTYDELLGKYEQNINKFYTGMLLSSINDLSSCGCCFS